jgi:D-3-phosphoglycerate dehydrogenase
VGKVGSHLAKLCKAFKMKIYGNDIKKNLACKYPWIHFCNLSKLAQLCDIITVHTPLDDSTRNLIDRKLIGKMKKGVVLINCARGGIIDERALIDNLKNKKISYAGLDVYVNEPNINAEFRLLKNVLLTPHQAGKTVESRVRISEMLAERLHKEMEKLTKKEKNLN